MFRTVTARLSPFEVADMFPIFWTNRLRVCGHSGFMGLCAWGTTGTPGVLEPQSSIQFCTKKKLPIMLELQKVE